MELLERTPQLTELAGHLEEASRRHGLLVLLGGEAGVGKSVFVQHFAQAAKETARVLIGMCDPLSTPRPLGPLLDIAAVMGTELERLIESDSREQVFRSFLATLQRAPRPTVAVFEDVHWADEATLDLLRFLGRRLHTTRTLLVATYRDDEVGPKHPLKKVIGDLATSGAVRRLTLSPLSESAVRMLAKGATVDPGELHRQTGGNPFFVTEVLAAGGHGIPPTVRDAVLARAARLSPEGRVALDAAAVIGFRVEPHLLAEVAGSERDAVEECLAIGTLRAQGEVFTFRHELAREAVYEALPLQRKIALHQRVLGALRATSSDDLARLAHHAEAAQDHQAVLEYAPAAARRAVGLGAHREAAAQYARALRFADKLPPLNRARLLEEYARECIVTDRSAEAIHARQAALDLWRQAGNRLKEGENLTHLARLLVGMGKNAEAEEASRTSIALLEALPEGSELALAYWYQAHLRMLNRDNALAIAWGQKAIALAERIQDTSSRIAAYNTVGTAMLLAGDEQGRVLIEQSRDLALQAQLDEYVGLAYGNLGSALGELYQFALADRYLQDGIAYCTDHDVDAHRLYMLSWQALSHLYQGHWREATETALVVLQRPSVATISRIMALIALGRVRARRGDPEVWTALDEALELAAQTKTLQRLAPARAARAEAAWLAGDALKTLEEACAAYDLALDHQHPWFTGELAYWRWKAGDLHQPPAEAARPFALQIMGDWQAAAAQWQHLHCPYEAARALAEGDEEDALRQAITTFEHLGAGPATAAVARRLRELGVKGIPRGPRPSTRANPANLTAREVEILKHLGEGLSNPEIARRLHLSSKTVGHHVSSILAKLEVHNRTEALKKAMRLNILDQDRDGDRLI
jgi:predicted ATPase/DNA-binding CsgD family transcriptional regulator